MLVPYSHISGSERDERGSTARAAQSPSGDKRCNRYRRICAGVAGLEPAPQARRGGRARPIAAKIGHLGGEAGFAATASESRIMSFVMTSASRERQKPQEARHARRREQQWRVEILNLNAIEQQDHTALANGLERDIDLTFGVERAAPLAPCSIEPALR